MAKTTTVIVGRIGAPHGVKGWVRVFSYTDPSENIFEYLPWSLFQGGVLALEAPELLDYRLHGDSFIAHFSGIDDRNQAAALTHAEIHTARSNLPATGEGSYYYDDLISLRVSNTQQKYFGEVQRVFSNGAHDVLEVAGDKTHFVPFIPDRTVVTVDLEHRSIVVDWDDDFQ